MLLPCRLLRFVVSFVVTVIILDALIYWLIPKVKKPNIRPIEELKNQLLIRAMPTYEESVGITLALLSSSSLQFHGELWLKAIVDFPKTLKSSIRLLGDMDKKPNVDLPNTPFKTFLLARIENGKPYYVAEDYQEEMYGNSNTIITELNGRFDGITTPIRIESFWRLIFNARDKTLHLEKDIINKSD